MSNYTQHSAHRVEGPDADALYAVAEPHGGYFTATHAAQVGYSRALLAHHVKSGLLERVERGVYRLRRFPEVPRADLIIAELRAGPESAVSHESALELYNLSDALPNEVHVTVRRTASRRKRGVRLHTGRLEKEDITSWDGITVTTVERTIADVTRSGLPEELVLGALLQALRRGLTTPARLTRLAEAKRGRVGQMVERALREAS